MTIDLDDLKTVWREDVQNASNLPSVDALVKQTRRRSRMTWFTVGLELLMLSGLLAILAYLIITSDDWLIGSLWSLCALVLIGVQIWMLRARNGLWRNSAIQPIQHARFCVAQAELNLKFARFSRIAAPVGLVTGYAAMSIHSGALLTDISRLGITIFAVVACLLFFQYWIGRWEAELNAARAIERELR